MPVVKGRHYPYTPAGKAAAAKAAKATPSRTVKPPVVGGTQDPKTNPKLPAKSLPAQASPMAKARFAGQRGMAKRKAR